MNRTSLLMILMLGVNGTLACGDDSSSTSDDSVGDAAVEAAASGSDDETSSSDKPAADDTTTEPNSDDTATAEDDQTADDSTSSDDSTVDDVADDSTTGSDNLDGGTETSTSVSDAGQTSTDSGTGANTDDVVDDTFLDDAVVDDTSSDLADASTETTPSDVPDSGDAGDLDASTSGNLIGVQGGTFSNAAGVLLQIGPDSIDPPGVITAVEVTPSNVEGLVSQAYDFGPDGTTFDPPATLTLPFDTGAAAGADVVIAWLDGNSWVPLTGCATQDDTVTCPVSHFTTFGVITQASDDAGTTPECPQVNCIENLRTACIPEGACHLSGDPTSSQVGCWENGVGFDLSFVAGLPTTKTTTVWHDGAGGACVIYEFDTTVNIQAGTSVSTGYWKDPDGTVIATETVDSETDTVTITCADDNETVVYHPPCKGPSDQSNGSTCDQGPCPM
ncbi:MAG TPA: hypothetical protein VHM70_06145 [Polyangiaceae bacterium]|nr:hypothetical protein [Polyangiaceae bacterium]